MIEFCNKFLNENKEKIKYITWKKVLTGIFLRTDALSYKERMSLLDKIYELHFK